MALTTFGKILDWINETGLTFSLREQPDGQWKASILNSNDAGVSGVDPDPKVAVKYAFKGLRGQEDFLETARRRHRYGGG